MNPEEYKVRYLETTSQLREIKDMLAPLLAGLPGKTPAILEAEVGLYGAYDNLAKAILVASKLPMPGSRVVFGGKGGIFVGAVEGERAGITAAPLFLFKADDGEMSVLKDITKLKLEA